MLSIWSVPSLRSFWHNFGTFIPSISGRWNKDVKTSVGWHRAASDPNECRWVAEVGDPQISRGWAAAGIEPILGTPKGRYYLVVRREVGARGIHIPTGSLELKGFPSIWLCDVVRGLLQLLLQNKTGLRYSISRNVVSWGLYLRHLFVYTMACACTIVLVSFRS